MSYVAHALLLAELPYRDPAWVYDLLKRRAETSRDANDIVGTEGEAVLLGRSDPLITLALARFSLDSKMVVRLFKMGGDVRTAALTNSASRNNRGMENLPEMLFDDDKSRLSDWLADAPAIDVLALFENPTLDDEVAGRFLLREAPFENVPEPQRMRAVWALSRNPALSASRKFGGYTDVGARAREALWKLAGLVEPSNAWAMALAHAYDDLQADEDALPDPIRVADRWGVDAEKSSVGYRLQVRMNLARLVLEQSSAHLPTFLSSQDDARRAAGLRWGRVSPSDVRTAIENDALFAIEHLSLNHQFWESEPARKAFWELCLDTNERVSTQYPRPTDFAREAARRFQARYPEWFSSK